MIGSVNVLNIVKAFPYPKQRCSEYQYRINVLILCVDVNSLVEVKICKMIVAEARVAHEGICQHRRPGLRAHTTYIDAAKLTISDFLANAEVALGNGE